MSAQTPAPTSASSWAPELRGAAAVVAAGLLLAGGLVLVQARLRPPPARGADAPADMFSATRALARLGRVLGDGRPHPVGSPAAAELRERLVAEFTALGVPAEIQPGFACGPRSASCGYVWNVVAALPGREPGPALLVSAHHDSVAAGPGAGDDGSGVSAALEVAHALKHGPPPRRPVVFVLVDGEEAGLLGAQAFVDAQQLPIAAAINLDAGGTRGVTSLTRTTASDAGLIPLIADAVPRPYGASIIGAVYGLTPYDTDFTVYKKAGWPALDFGFGEDKAHYHTPLDRLDNLDPDSVQHLGDTALAAVRALAEADLEDLPDRSRVYVDALGAALVHWPALVTPLLAALALAGLLWRARREPPASRRSRLWRTLGFPLLVLVPAAVGAGLMALLAWATAAELPGHAEPLAARVALWTAVLAASAAVAGLLARVTARAWIWLGPWLWLAVISLATAIAVPGASVGVLPPALVASLLAAWTVLSSERHARSGMPDETWPPAWVVIVSLALPAVMWLQAAVRVEAMFGLGPFAAGVLALLASLLAPLWVGLGRLRRPLVLALAVAGAVASVVAVVTPPYSEARPRRLSVLYHLDADAGAARWITAADAPLPPSFAAVAEFGAAGPAFPWDTDESPSFAAPAEPTVLQPPEVTPEVDELPPPDTGRRVAFRLRSPRGARVAALLLPDAAGPRSLTIEGVVVPPYPEHRRKHVKDAEVYAIVALPPEGVVVTVELASTEPVQAVVWDLSEGLPAAGAALQSARPTWAVPSHGGDRTMVSRTVSL